jgi:perosamine synthetase
MGSVTRTPLEPDVPAEPSRDRHVRAALLAALRSGSWDGYDGPHVPELQQRLAEFHQVELAYTCCSGTFAVELALRAAGVRPGDEVLLAGYDFPGNFRSIEAIGARPVLVDIEPTSWCLDPEQMQRALEQHDPRAVVVSHLHGTLADMRAICHLAEQRGVAVIEDACQATGATVQGRAAGSWGDVGVLSFGGSKLLTSGRGGAILTSRPEIVQRAKIHCEQGNHAFPLSELQAAVLLPQLGQLPQRNQFRRQAVRRLLDELSQHEVPGWFASADTRGDASYYKLGWLLPPEYTADSRERLLDRLRAGLASPADTGLVGEGFRGFVRRSSRRCIRVGDLGHSRAAAARTLLIHHVSLLRPSSYLRQLAAALHQAAERTT